MDIALVAGIIAGVIATVAAALAAVTSGTKLRAGALELSVEGQAQQFRASLKQEAGKADEPAQKAFALAKEYHAQGLAQSKISFILSLVFAALGFAVIVVAIFSVDNDAPLVDQAQTFVSLISGTVIESVSALFFVQSNRARQTMVEFFDKLRVDRKLDEALQLTREITDPLLASRMRVMLGLNLAGAPHSDDHMRTLFASDPSTENRLFRVAKGAEEKSPAGEHVPGD